MATADQVKALVKSHTEGDDARFYSVAAEAAAKETILSGAEKVTTSALTAAIAERRVAIDRPGVNG